MKKYFFLVIFVLFAAIGCTKKDNNPAAPGTGTDTTAAASKVTEAVTALENKNITLANQKFEEALASDPNNLRARMGAAVTGAGILFNDAEFQSLAKDILENEYANFPHDANGLLAGPKRPGAVINPLLAAKALKISQSVTASRIQDIIERKVITTIDKALVNLAKVEADPNFSFTIPTQVSKSDRPIILDLGEVYALETLLYGFKAICLEIIAYNADCNFNNTTGAYNPFNDTNYPNFGTLKDAKYPKNSRLAWVSACDKFIAGINFIKNSDTDNAIDGGIKLDGSETQAVADVTKAKSSLEGTTQTIVSGDGTMSVDVNLYDFLETPITDLDPYLNLPQDAQGNPVFPGNYDYTLSGLFPNMNKTKFDSLVVN